MFRAQQNAFDEAVAKATDENLTSENWEFILDVCDKVSADESGAKDAVAAMIKRLAHRNANVQLYTLELANSLSQNCGPTFHRELSSRSFTDALLRLAGERTTHQQVKAKILERMGEWTEMFSSNPSLGIMEQSYLKLKAQNPALHPPSKPVKQQITEVDRRKEEEELQMALALSIKDKGTAAAGSSSSAQQGASELPANTASGSNLTAAAAPAPPQGTTAATVSRVRALYDFQPSEPGELQFRKGDIIAVLESVYKDWWKGSLRGQTGIFPLNYVEKLSDPTQEELHREAQMEAEVFAQIKNVEKLLTLLSTGGTDMNRRDNEEITSLYQSTVAIRPKLIELIGKYSQKKDDFTQLNEKFIKARRDYETLLESSMAHPAQQYGRQVHTMYGYPGAAAGAPQGYPPPQADPQRFYTPQPQAQGRPQEHTVPQNGPMPFYVTTQTPLPYPSSLGSPGPRHRTPSGSKPFAQQQQAPDSYLPYSHQRPHSTYDHGPQELSTSVYDSPVDQPHQQFPPQQTPAPGTAPTAASHTPYPPQFQPQPQQQQHQPSAPAPTQDYSPSVYGSEHNPNQDPNSALSQNAPAPTSQPQAHAAAPPQVQQQPPQQQQYPPHPSAYPSAPTHQPPSVPHPQPTPTPPIAPNQSSAYPSLTAQAGGPPPQQYQAYSAQSASAVPGMAQQAQAGAGPGDPSRYYR